MSGDPLQAALKKLNYRSYSQVEIRDFLLASHFTPHQAAEAIEQLKGWGYLDDRALGRQIFNHYIRTKPLGRRFLIKKLTDRGLDGEVIESLMNDYNEEIELEAALGLSQKYLSRKKAELPAARMFLARYLEARGFSWSIIGKAIKLLSNPSDQT